MPKRLKKTTSSEGGSFPSASSSHLKESEPRWIVIGNPENRRVGLFGQALSEHGLRPAKVLSYLDLLCNEGLFARSLADSGPCLVRIESPGENHQVERLLIARGAGDAAGISRAAALRLRFDRGRIRHTHAWQAGFYSLLEEIERALAQHPDATALNCPSAIRLLFDKPRCHAFLSQRGISVPRALPPVASYDELRAAISAAGLSRVFVKLACGSSASGVVAFSAAGKQALAVTPMELERVRGQPRFYNNLRLSRYTRERDLRTLFDFLFQEGAHVEEWLPKASQGGRNFDLRILTIAGQPCHGVVRTSRSPITNLHLGNRRGELAALQAAAGDRWEIVEQLCRDAASALPTAHCVGWDVLITPGFRRAYILEGNAFGDLLPGILHMGRSTYWHGVHAMLRLNGTPAADARARL
jgi:hypothetical protein